MVPSSKITLPLFLYLSSFALFSPSSPSRVLPSDSQKVSVGLYYESLCPDSATFIVDYLGKLFEDDLISIVDLKLYPWGNAKLRGNDTFECQHGPYECLLNTVEACAIDAWPDLVRLSLWCVVGETKKAICKLISRLGTLVFIFIFYGTSVCFFNSGLVMNGAVITWVIWRKIYINLFIIKGKKRHLLDNIFLDDIFPYLFSR